MVIAFTDVEALGLAALVAGSIGFEPTAIAVQPRGADGVLRVGPGGIEDFSTTLTAFAWFVFGNAASPIITLRIS